MAPSSGHTYPMPQAWYDQHMTEINAADMMKGLGIDKKALAKLKTVAASLADQLNPNNEKYSGLDGQALRARLGEQALATLDEEFRNAPDDWVKFVVTFLMQQRHSNRKRRKAREDNRANDEQLPAQASSEFQVLVRPTRSLASSDAGGRARRPEWPPATRLSIMVHDSNRRLTLRTKLDPVDVSEYEPGGAIVLSIEKLRTAVEANLREVDPTLDDVLYLSPRQDQHLAIRDRFSLSTAFRDIWTAGMTDIIVTSVPLAPGAVNAYPPAVAQSVVPSTAYLDGISRLNTYSQHTRERQHMKHAQDYKPDGASRSREGHWSVQNTPTSSPWQPKPPPQQEIVASSPPPPSPGADEASSGQGDVDMLAEQEAELSSPPASPLHATDASPQQGNVVGATKQEEPSSLPTTSTKAAEVPQQGEEMVVEHADTPTSANSPHAAATAGHAIKPSPPFLASQPGVAGQAPLHRKRSEGDAFHSSSPPREPPSKRHRAGSGATPAAAHDVNDDTAPDHNVTKTAINAATDHDAEARLRHFISGPPDMAACLTAFTDMVEPGEKWKASVTIGTVPIYLVDLMRLSCQPLTPQDGWFNDALIDSLLGAEPAPKGVQLLPSRSTSDRTWRPGSSLREQIPQLGFTCDRALLVCLLRGNHWMTAEAIAGVPPVLHVYDSLVGGEAVSPKIRRRLSKIGFCISPDVFGASASTILPLVEGSTAKQDNAIDCGPYAVFNTVARMHGQYTRAHNPPAFGQGSTSTGPMLRRVCTQRLTRLLRHAHDESVSAGPTLAEEWATSWSAGAYSPFPRQEVAARAQAAASGWTTVNSAQPHPNATPNRTMGSQLPPHSNHRPFAGPTVTGDRSISLKTRTPFGHPAESPDPEEVPKDDRVDPFDEDEDENLETLAGEDIMEISDEEDEEDALDVLDDPSERTLGGLLAFVDPCGIQLTILLFPWATEEMIRDSELDISTALVWGTTEAWTWRAYQLFFLAVAFFRERRLMGGGTLADDPGAGKTRQLSGTFFVEGQHVKNRAIVEEAWAAEEIGFHLPKNAATGSQCPTPRSSQAIACYCEPQNRTQVYKQRVKRGLCLVVAPSGGLAAFVSELTKMLKGSTCLEDKTWAPRIAVHSEGFEKDDFCPPLSQAEIDASCPQADWSEAIVTEAEKAKGHEGRWITSFGGATASDEDATTHSPGKMASRIMIITTPGCVEKRVEEAFRATRNSVWSKPKGPAPIKLDQTQFIVRRLLVDEAHKRVNATMFPQFIKRVRDNYTEVYPGQHPIVWGATGTPDHASILHGMLFTCITLQRPEWQNAERDDEALRLVGEKACRKQMASMRALQRRTPGKHSEKDKDTQAKVIAYLGKVTPLFHMRRTYETRWFDGKKVIPLKAKLNLQFIKVFPSPCETALVEEIDNKIKIEQYNAHQKRVAEWEEITPRKTLRPIMGAINNTTSYHTARATHNIAFLVDYWHKTYHADKPDPPSFVSRDPVIAGWLRNPRSPEFQEAVKQSDIESCSKWQWICSALKKLKVGKRKDDSVRKVLVVTDNNCTVAAYTQQLESTFPDAVVYLTARTTTAQRKQAVKDFDDVESRWIMLATEASVALGYNLQRADTIIVVEPCFQGSTLRQVLARAWRVGQLADVVDVFILQNMASSMEERAVLTCNVEQELKEFVGRFVVPEQTGREVVDVDEQEVVDVDEQEVVDVDEQEEV